MLIGPFKQIVTLRKLPLKGPLADHALEIIADGGILVKDGVIEAVEPYTQLFSQADSFMPIDFPAVVFPGLVDAHTHICWAGDRSDEYANRLEGITYQQLAAKGGGILRTMRATRSASEDDLLMGLLDRLKLQQRDGITTCEVKSGYGLDLQNELKCLRTIQLASRKQPIQIVATCLAAHILPPEFSDKDAYLSSIKEELWPLLQKENLAHRMDIFIENEAFPPSSALSYLKDAQKCGFATTAHAGQFSTEGIHAAIEAGVHSADHLECVDEAAARILAKTNTVATVLPGATLGLGLPFPPARMLLDTGNCLAIASDWNPGSAPMGRLLTQASLLGAAQKLTMTETWAGITFRAAQALDLHDRGVIEIGKRADLAIFPCQNWQEVLYYQGSLLPKFVMIGGRLW
ncbi:MAG: imidazolonepropionase [Parachlamydiales bacterium]|jgi:imidazolonepropionase